jgi:hypothetical protein
MTGDGDKKRFIEHPYVSDSADVDREDIKDITDEGIAIVDDAEEEERMIPVDD